MATIGSTISTFSTSDSNGQNLKFQEM